jgi:hypothetical protein
LVEQKLHVRRHIVSDQNKRWFLLGIHSNVTDVPAARS